LPRLDFPGVAFLATGFVFEYLLPDASLRLVAFFFGITCSSARYLLSFWQTPVRFGKLISFE
jgi:hypothetical protein